MYSTPDGAVYDGAFVQGEMTGSGTYMYPNGESYEGEWLDGKRNGKGTMTYADGSVYEGANHLHGISCRSLPI